MAHLLRFSGSERRRHDELCAEGEVNIANAFQQSTLKNEPNLAKKDISRFAVCTAMAFPDDGLESVSLIGRFSEDFFLSSKVYDIDFLVIYETTNCIDLSSIYRNLVSAYEKFARYVECPISIVPNLLCGPICPPPREKITLQAHILLYSRRMFEKRGKTCQYDAIHTAKLLQGKPVNDVLPNIGGLRLKDILDDPFGLRSCRTQLSQKELHFFQWRNGEGGIPRREVRKVPIRDTHTLFSLVVYACVRTTRNTARFLMNRVGNKKQELEWAREMDVSRNLAEISLSLESLKRKYEKGSVLLCAEEVEQARWRAIQSLTEMENRLLAR
jgi:hypothetical protein